MSTGSGAGLSCCCQVRGLSGESLRGKGAGVMILEDDAWGERGWSWDRGCLLGQGAPSQA